MLNLKKILVLSTLIFTTLFCVAQQCQKDTLSIAKKQAIATPKKAAPVKPAATEAEVESFSIFHILTLKFM